MEYKEKLITMTELKKMYNLNEGGFREYVNRFARSKNKPISEVLSLRITNYKAQDIKLGNENEQKMSNK